jgi:hypothetical protein
MDVAAGAVTGALFFAKIFDVVILLSGMVSLGLTVWIIYTIDHLIDARRITQMASTERHRFHQLNFNVLFVLLMIATVIDGSQLLFIRRTVFLEGLGLAIVIVVYFLLQRYLKFLKELIGALLYAGGVLLIPFSVKTSALSTTQSLLIGQFVITALINLLLFSWFDKSQDEQDSHSSFATIMGGDATKNFLRALFILQSVLAFVQLTSSEFKSTGIIVLMNALLLVIFLNRKYFETDDRYRLLGDAVFFVPLIYVFT